jgi:3-phosphoshikimate 1-carboxyvinyltransferase
MENSIEIEPFRYQGTLHIPASKSYLQRAIAIGALCEENTWILNYYPSNDARAALNMAFQLGAEIQQFETKLRIKKGTIASEEILLNCYEAGLSMRMFSPIAALQNKKCTFIGEGSLLKRPVNMIEEALSQLGVFTKSNQGLLPLEILGPAHANTLEIDGSVSSQLLTGLLIALPNLETDSIIKVKNLISKPYVQMTLDILKAFGVEIQNDNFKHFIIPGNQKPKRSEYYVEGDWSGAAFHLVGAAISGELHAIGLNVQSSQADRAILDALKLAGADITEAQQEITIKKNELRAFHFDATDCPDLFPPLAVLAAACEGTSAIKGVTRLYNKESNRALSIQSEFKKLNVDVFLEDDIMKIGKSKVIGNAVLAHNDHRIAMACALLATQCQNKICIQDYQSVNKSYPTFFDDLNKISVK